MATLPKLDTSVNRPDLQSARNSYASATDSEPRSSRSSYASSTSSRTSFSSLRDSFQRTSSFSRTADVFVPDSETTTPLTSVDSQTNSPSSSVNEKVLPPPPPSETVVNDGPTTLRNLENVQTVLCVAFGAFNRYYISWQDTDDQFHQKCNNLPPRLHTWLFPLSFPPRHIPTLQVTFGSGDDYFASDRDGKTSNRDSVSLSISDAENARKPVPRLADVARNFLRGKANTVSTSTENTNSSDMVSVVAEVKPKMDRRRTFIGGQSVPMRIERLSIHAAEDTKGAEIGTEDTKQEYRQRKSIVMSVSPVAEEQTPKLESMSVRFMSDGTKPQKVDLGIEESGQELEMEQKSTGLLSTFKFPAIEEPTEKIDSTPKIEDRQRRPSSEAEEAQAAQRRRRLWRRSTIMRMPLPIVVPPPEQKIEIVKAVTPVPVIVPSQNSDRDTKDAISAEIYNEPPQNISEYEDTTRQSKQEFQEFYQHQDFQEESSFFYQPQEYYQEYQPEEPQLSMGSFQDFFRAQYSLGDALGYV